MTKIISLLEKDFNLSSENLDKALAFLGRKDIVVTRLSTRDQTKKMCTSANSLQTVFCVDSGKVYANMWSSNLQQLEAKKMFLNVQMRVAAMIVHELHHVGRDKHYAKKHTAPSRIDLFKDEVQGYGKERKELVKYKAFLKQLYFEDKRLNKEQYTFFVKDIENAIAYVDRHISVYKNARKKLVAQEKSKKQSQEAVAKVDRK